MTELRAMLQDRIPIAEVPILLGVSRQTVWRWVRQGFNGYRLRSYKLGHKRITTERDITLFVEQISGIEPNTSPAETVHQHNRRREKQIASARKFLEEEGL